MPLSFYNTSSVKSLQTFSQAIAGKGGRGKSEAWQNLGNEQQEKAENENEYEYEDDDEPQVRTWSGEPGENSSPWLHSNR